ncbi:MAG: glutamate 5-kinase [Candidatus Aureabacteria bacterium]|nr:glutamate 5-kinase [Candidatus Auribacterota bacterium]
MKDIRQRILKNAKRIVIKIGSNVLAAESGSLNRSRVSHLAEQIYILSTQYKKQIILVSSGAIASGMGKLGIRSRPQTLPDIQALAAVGQTLLIEAYRNEFNKHHVEIAQLLVTQEDFQNPNRYLNITNTFSALLNKKIIPIVNENDTVATHEITFGDNDRLCTLVSHTVYTDLVIILSNIDGFLDMEKAGSVIPLVEKIDKNVLFKITDSQSSFGAGGMKSKILAIQQLVNSQKPVILANGNKMHVLQELFEGKELGTLFLPSETFMKRKKRWIAYFAKPHGEIHVDEGAKTALIKKNSSLLAIGIRNVTGEFNKGMVVRVLCDREEVARGLVNYSSADILKIKGLKSREFSQVLENNIIYEEVIHKDNLAVIQNQPP